MPADWKEEQSEKETLGEPTPQAGHMKQIRGESRNLTRINDLIRVTASNTESPPR
jgi:hypothetical protein